MTQKELDALESHFIGLGEKLRKRRLRLGLSISLVAKRAKISRCCVRDAEAGALGNALTLAKQAAVLGHGLRLPLVRG